MSGAMSAAGLMMVGGSLVKAAGARDKAQSEKNALEYQAAVAGNNAQIAEWGASDALTRGARAEQTQRLKTAQLKGTQRASFAARGVALDEGSPLAILQDTEYMGELDAATIRDNAAREAWASRNRAQFLRSDASMLQTTAGNIDPDKVALTSLLTDSGQVASSWYSYKSKAG